MKIGLFFGTFNPIHVGHLIIASHIVNTTDLKKIWFVVTPQNPLKNKKTLLADYHRLQLVRIAIEDNPRFVASNIEFSLPQPNYTVHTLAHLKEKYPNYEFSLILGEDNLRTFDKWYNYEHILENYQLYIYPRNLTTGESISSEKKNDPPLTTTLKNHPNIHYCLETPIMKISSSFIRNSIQKGQSVRYLLTEEVFNYVEEMNFYK